MSDKYNEAIEGELHRGEKYEAVKDNCEHLTRRKSKMRRQAAKIKVCVVNAAFLISPFLINEKADSNAAVTVSVSESVINSLDNVWFNYEEFDDIEALRKINDNIKHIDEAIDILREAYNKSSNHADMLSLVYIEKARSELEDARIECCKEKIHYMSRSGIH